MNTKRNRIYITADAGQGTIRIALNPEAAIEIGDRNWGTGVSMDRCWFGKSRIVTQSYSIWDRGDGIHVGTRYNVISNPEEILDFCRRADIDPPTWIKAEEL